MLGKEIMKITPISGGSAAPGVSINPVGGSSVSAERRDAAVRIALGQAKLAPSDTPIDPELEQKERTIRKIKMKTNVTPEQYMPQVTEMQSQPVTSDIPDNSEQAPVPEVTQPISPQLAALAKQRRLLQAKESELKAREKAFLEQRQPGIDLEKLKAQPLSVLREAGVTYDQLTQAILNDNSGMNPDLQAIDAKIQALEKGFEEKLTARDQQAEQQVLAEINREAESLVYRNQDQYELISKTKSQKEIGNLVHRVFRQGWPEKGYPPGYVLETSEAADIVENFLFEDYRPITQAKKYQSQIPAKSPVQQQPTQMRTLTNRDLARPVIDRKARAMAAFYGTLKK